MSAPVHINFTQFSVEAVRVVKCPTCERRRRMLFQFQEWYGGTFTCTGCGDRWTDGQMHERPFRRGWRGKQIAGAKKRIHELRVGGSPTGETTDQ